MYRVVKFNRGMVLILLAVLVAGPLLSACAQPTPTPTPPPSPTAALKPIASPFPLQITMPAPTPEPTQIPLPPTVVAVQPDRGQEQLLSAPVVVTFDQAMDPKTTSTAFQISPDIPGTVEVSANKLLWRPGQPLARATRYDVTLQGASSAQGLPMAQPVSFRFVTVGYLEVTSTQPSADTQEVTPDTPISVVFNRPVVPLTGVDQQAGLPDPLRFSPPVSGQGRWLNTSVYTFKPDKTLAAGTAYSVTVSATLSDTTGSVLAEPYTWSFTTASPVVEHTQPEAGAAGVAPSSVISVTFSQAMDPASTQQAFSLQGPAGAATGTFNWSDAGQEVGFKPAQPLTYGGRYTITVSTAARPAAGVGTLRATYSSAFDVVPLPAVTNTDPQDGATDLNPVGAVNIYFRGAISETTLVNAISISPVLTSTEVLTYFNSYDNRFFVTWPWDARTTYTLTLKGTVGDIYGNTLGKDLVVHFATGDFRPFVELNVAGPVGTYNAYTRTVASILHRNVTTVDLKLYRLSVTQFKRLTGEQSYDSQRNPGANKGVILREWTLKPPSERNRSQVWFEPLLQETGEPLAPGLYYLEVTSPEMKYDQDTLPSAQIIALSPYNVILKASNSDALVWVTDLKSGQPVPGLSVTLEDEQGLAIGGSTNRDGVYTTTYPTRDIYRPLFAFVHTPSGVNFGVTQSRWTDGIDPWNFQLYSETYWPRYNGFVYTDRPIYRPSQTVYFKGIVRLDNDARYALPDLKQVSVVINDQNGTEVYHETLPLNPLGTFNGEFKLGDEAALGYYNIAVQLDPNYGTGISFQVAEYRKPEFELSVATDKPEYRQGETMTVTAQATYFFGGPVKNADIHWSLLSQDAFFNYTGSGSYSFQDINTWEQPQFNAYGERISEGSGRTDEQGRLVFSVPADITRQPQSQTFTFDVSVTDINNQVVSGSAAAMVHKGDFYIGVAPAEYVALVNKVSRINFITVDPDSRPVGPITLSVGIAKAEWYSVQQRDDSGRFFWTSKVRETPVFTDTLATAGDGSAQLGWTPTAGGQYLIRATASDSHDQVIRSAAFVWVSGSPGEYVSWRRDNNDHIDLVSDRKSYAPGDTARVLVPSPFEGNVTALLTTERGHVYSYKVITLTSNSTTLEVPVEPIHAPDMFVSVVLAKGQDASNPLAQFRLGYTPLIAVSTEQQQVYLTVTPSATKLGPRDTVSFTVKATDYLSRPLDAEVSLALVDKAVLSLADNNTQPIVDVFYRQRGLGIVTAATLVLNIDRINEQQARGAKGGGGGDGSAGPLFVRSEFPDNALWRADLRTGVSGSATLSVTLPDNLTTWRLLAKAVTSATAVGETFSDIQVTRDLLVRPVLPRFFVAGDQAEIAAVINNNTAQTQTVRVTLSASGLDLAGVPQQSVTVPAFAATKVPWNVTVQAADQVVVKFDAQATRLSDAVQITLPVYRYTTPETVGTAGQVEQGVGRLESIVLPPTAMPNQGELLLTLEPSLAAGMQSGLTYLEHYQYECTEQTLSRFLPNVLTYRALKQLGIERPDLAETLPGLVSVGLQRLYNRQNVDGGWGWWPNDPSDTFISGYVVFGLLQAREAGISVDGSVLSRGLTFLERRLLAPADLQGYRANQQAFLLYVLAEGGRGSVGRTVALYEVRERLANYGKAYLALALARLDAAPAAGALATPAPLFTSTITVTVPATPVPQATEAAPEQGGTSGTVVTATVVPQPTAVVTGSLRTRADTLLDDLRAAAVESAAGAHWEEKTVDFMTMNTDIRSTAVILVAFSRLRPEDAVAPGAVRWLMSVRGAGHWASTQETAWSLLALTDWMVASGELKADYSYRISFNSQVLAEGAVTPQTVDQTIELKRQITNMLHEQANALAFERFSSGTQTGDGRLYYSAYLRYFLPVEQVKARDRGISIHREYRQAQCGQKPGESCPITDQATVGDLIDVRLTLVVPNDLSYVVVEDPLPAGAEAVDTSLKTTSKTAQGPDLQPEQTPAANPWSYFWLPSHSELRDEKVALFATSLPAGTYEYTYQMRASLPGRFLTLPATGYQMYFPDVWGRSDGGSFQIADVQ